jgi:peptidyl-prolyl cis-trans isomerase C
MTFFRTLVCLSAAAGLMAQTAPPKADLGQLKVELKAEDPPAKVPPDRVVLTVGPVKITAEQWDQILDTLPEPRRSNAKGPARKQFGEDLLRILVLSEEGIRRGINETPAFQAQSMVQIANLLSAITYEQINREIKVGDDDLRKYYEDHRRDYEEIKARNILVRVAGAPIPVRAGQKELSEEEALAKAKDLRKRVMAGEDFAVLAITESDDTPSAPKGGDVGTVKRGQMLPAFEDAAFALKPGEVSEPVRSILGYHVIKLESRTMSKTFEDVKGELEKKVRPEAARAQLEDLVKKATTTMDPEFFGWSK